jgi:tRNA (guanine37-N1)-methyltransferase
MMKRAIDAGLIKVSFYNPRDFTKNKHKKVDDIPYGGGPGMVMMAQPIIDAWEKIIYSAKPNFIKRVMSEIASSFAMTTTKKRVFKTILLSPGGKTFTTEYAKTSAQEYTDIIFICGRYEGIDSRVEKITGAELVSIGDYVLTGGELAAMVMMDSISRQVKGVLGNEQSLEEERVSSHEMYTRPAELQHKGKTYKVPEVLMNGNHKEIDEWRRNH